MTYRPLALLIAFLLPWLPANFADAAPPCHRITDPTSLNSSNPENDLEPHLVTDDLGHWVAVWASRDDLSATIGPDWDILVARSADDGETWTASQALNTNADSDSGNDREPRIATDGLGNWVAVWASRSDLGGTIGGDWDVLVSSSTDNGVTWSDPQPLNTNADVDAGIDRDPWVATDDLGQWVAVWPSTDSLDSTIGSDSDVLVSLSTDDGVSWSAPQPLNTNAGTDDGDDQRPHLTTDAGGRWVVVWESEEDLDGSIGTDWDILLSRSGDDGATWSEPQALNTHADGDGWPDQQPRVTTNRAGDWITVWASQEDVGGTIGNDPDILVSQSTDNGATWAAPQALNSNAGTDGLSIDDGPDVNTDTSGTWVVVWHSPNTLGGTIGSDSDILFSLSTDDGATWSDVRPLNVNADSDSGDDYRPHVAPDDLGNWLVVWHSDDTLQGTVGDDWDIFNARLGCPDCDDDGFGLPGSASCPAGSDEDCDDDDDTIHPGATQECDGLNNDCGHPSWPDLDGTNEFDDDGDTITECGGDCDDTSAAVYPGAPQICDGLNNDCDDPSWPSVAGTDDGDDDGDGMAECAGDCDDADGGIYQDAPETNDGVDNQCPGDGGHGIVDEISGLAGFFNPSEKYELSWPPQALATSYEVARSTHSDHSAACVILDSDEASLLDSEPPGVNGTHYYLVRANDPNQGSWGKSSAGNERTFVCGVESSCSDGFDNDGDGDVDCDDPDCEGSPDCPEICDDGLDNDWDGDTDCVDSECDDHEFCIFTFSFTDGPGNDIPDWHFYNFLVSIADQLDDRDHILFEMQPPNPSDTLAWCAENGRWYADTYLDVAAPPGGATRWSGADHARWYMKSLAGGWQGPVYASFQNLYGGDCFGGTAAYAWCSELNLGSPPGLPLNLTIRPARVDYCESLRKGQGCIDETRVVTIRFAGTRESACGF